MCTVLLPQGVNSTAFNNYIITFYYRLTTNVWGTSSFS